MGFGIGLPRNFNSCRKKEPMKVIIKNENKSSEIKYPCLMAGPNGIIVLFLGDSSGLVLKHHSYPVGKMQYDWGIHLFTPFTGTVELSND